MQFPNDLSDRGRVSTWTVDNFKFIVRGTLQEIEHIFGYIVLDLSGGPLAEPGPLGAVVLPPHMIVNRGPLAVPLDSVAAVITRLGEVPDRDPMGVFQLQLDERRRAVLRPLPLPSVPVERKRRLPAEDPYRHTYSAKAPRVTFSSSVSSEPRFCAKYWSTVGCLACPCPRSHSVPSGALEVDAIRNYMHTKGWVVSPQATAVFARVEAGGAPALATTVPVVLAARPLSRQAPVRGVVDVLVGVVGLVDG